MELRFQNVPNEPNGQVPQGTPVLKPKRHAFLIIITALLLLAGAFGVWYFSNPLPEEEMGMNALSNIVNEKGSGVENQIYPPSNTYKLIKHPECSEINPPKIVRSTELYKEDTYYVDICGTNEKEKDDFVAELGDEKFIVFTNENKTALISTVSPFYEYVLFDRKFLFDFHYSMPIKYKNLYFWGEFASGPGDRNNIFILDPLTKHYISAWYLGQSGKVSGNVSGSVSNYVFDKPEWIFPDFLVFEKELQWYYYNFPEGIPTGENIGRLRGQGFFDLIKGKYFDINLNSSSSPLYQPKIDNHECNGYAGYSWCEIKSKCLRVWEEKCE